MNDTRTVQERPKPVLRPAYCKGCGRCIDSCAKGCITEGTEIQPASGLVPVHLDLERCNACGLCFEACPEPYGLVPPDVAARADAAAARPAAEIQPPADEPWTRIPLGEAPALMVKGTHAAAIGALLAGCRHFFGYPITPSTEGAEIMARLLPTLGGSFLQAASEVATINYIYGCGAAGRPAMTFTSSPGLSLMLEGLSYLVGSEIPAVVVDVNRAGPGLGNIGPEQSDLKLVCRGLGHGSTHAVVLAPASPQEMLDLTMRAFEIAFRWRNPVIVLADAHLGQMTGRVVLPDVMLRPGLPGWAVWGDAAHRRNVVTSILLREQDLEEHNLRILDKYGRIAEAEQRADAFRCDDAEVLAVAIGTPARMAKGAVEQLRDEGIAAGLFRPVTLWPFPIDALRPLLARTRRIVVAEASDGQLEDELRLALSHAGIQDVEIAHVRRHGGILPSLREVADALRRAAREGVHGPNGAAHGAANGKAVHA